MAIVRYPRMSDFSGTMRELDRTRREMEQLFTGLLGRTTQPMRSGVFPPINVSEDGDKMYATAELPGVRPEDIEISVVGGTLTISGERRPDGAENVSFHRRERRFGSFHKSITLPNDINADAVVAESKDGVLRLVLPKAEHARPKKITVKSE